MKLKLYQVDAFTGCVFGGNPAAVVPLSSWLPEPTLQAIALENNLSETAFFVPAGQGRFHLRWFTPKHEVPLCGHATLASAHVVLRLLHPEMRTVRFDTLSGELTVKLNNELLVMDFPARVPRTCPAPAILLEGLGAKPVAVMKTDQEANYYAVFDTEAEIRRLAPDMALLEKLDPAGVAVTGPGDQADFVSRYFAPCHGIPEDPVTGSTHCALIPYWAGRLGKRKLFARQVSTRGGELHCELLGERVSIAGKAALYMQGEIQLPADRVTR